MVCAGVCKMRSSIKPPNPIKERDELFAAFRTGELKCLVVSKVANFSVDLPDATIAIQVSGAFGSRQEEAQRLGRILRPKSDGRGARFYSVVARDTIDQDFAQNRQRFLAEQGYLGDPTPNRGRPFTPPSEQSRGV